MAIKDRKQYDVSDDKECVNKHFSATYLMISLAVNHFEQGIEILEQYGLTEHEIKRSLKTIEYQFDRLDKEYRKLITDKGGKVFVQDYEDLLKRFDKILGFDDNKK